VKLCVLSFVIVIASCKKDKIEFVAPEEPPPANTDGSILNITALYLDEIKYTPSTALVEFKSVAFGREANGVRPAIPLTFSGWTHPSVLYFEKKWNNYHYWAALTPYPDTDSQYENPHIFCSDDGVKWIEPKGIINPIDPCPPGFGFNSDVNLMLDKNILYCYWRATENNQRAIYIRKSADGVHWGEKETVCIMPYGVVDVIAPSFLKDGNSYYCYSVCGVENEAGSFYNRYSIRRMVSSDPIKFNPEKDKGFDLINVNGRPWGNEQEPWHIEVKKLKNIWMMLVTTTGLNRYGGGGRLFMGYSTDGKDFTFSNKSIGDFTASTYKSSFNARMDPIQNKINVEMWRAMMSNGWAVFHDNFSIKVK